MTQLVEITDEFTEPKGEFEGYSVIPLAQEEQLRKQKHVNIRSFVPDKPAAPFIMLFMDKFVMGEMNNLEVGVFDLRTPVINNEGWTNGKVGSQADRNNWNGISVECNPAISAETITQSVVTQNG